MRGSDWRGVIALLIAAAMEHSSAEDRRAAVTDAVAGAATMARRAPADVTLIAVTKTHGADAIEPLLAAGHRDFGENRVQEATAKWPALKERYPDVRLHLIGQLQSNKAADCGGFVRRHPLGRPAVAGGGAGQGGRSGGAGA
jgi:hypothetical protein